MAGPGSACDSDNDSDCQGDYPLAEVSSTPERIQQSRFNVHHGINAQEIMLNIEKIPKPLSGLGHDSDTGEESVLPGATSSVILKCKRSQARLRSLADSESVGEIVANSSGIVSVDQVIFTLSELLLMELSQKQAWTREETNEVIRLIQNKMFVKEDLPADLYAKFDRAMGEDLFEVCLQRREKTLKRQ